jgi:hypothetical protein
MQVIGSVGNKGRAAYRNRTWCKAIASLPREGRIIRACRRALIARDGLVSMRDLRSWAYPGQPRQHWHQTNVYRALRKLGAQRIGWGIYAISAS